MQNKVKIVRIIIAILSICLISMVSGTTLKSGSYYLTNSSPCDIETTVPENLQTDKIVKKQYLIAGLKMSENPENQSFVLFISGLFGVIGFGWVKKKKI